MKWILPLAALLWLALVGAHLSQVEPAAGRAVAAQKPGPSSVVISVQ